ncbi:unnamed protein product [Vitrella brassicaformis CCMP3155]|uniref:Uncharacterized protein n=1 Tax=Vitrella brassicaformis (strain CCMP3155) TaxID=1169540 RepID=A0A0G4F3D2_VITBC|nr:unnamed protein product [Vitrella brassicaformis CCMP3155]|eukprot:CEM06698.1 unnamed protein product [Vitrella brassicaformis CCMP3155]
MMKTDAGLFVATAAHAAIGALSVTINVAGKPREMMVLDTYIHQHYPIGGHPDLAVMRVEDDHEVRAVLPKRLLVAKGVGLRHQLHSIDAARFFQGHVSDVHEASRRAESSQSAGGEEAGSSEMVRMWMRLFGVSSRPGDSGTPLAMESGQLGGVLHGVSPHMIGKHSSSSSSSVSITNETVPFPILYVSPLDSLEHPARNFVYIPLASSQDEDSPRYKAVEMLEEMPPTFFLPEHLDKTISAYLKAFPLLTASVDSKQERADRKEARTQAATRRREVAEVRRREAEARRQEAEARRRQLEERRNARLKRRAEAAEAQQQEEQQQQEETGTSRILRQMARGFAAMEERFAAFEERIEERFDAFEERFDAVAARFDAADEGRDGLAEEIAGLAEGVDGLQERLERVEEDIDDMRGYPRQDRCPTAWVFRSLVEAWKDLTQKDETELQSVTLRDFTGILSSVLERHPFPSDVKLPLVHGDSRHTPTVPASTAFLSQVVSSYLIDDGCTLCCETWSSCV